jgi:photosystem II stability/assembly factor-like uncharacterized protein
MTAAAVAVVDYADHRTVMPGSIAAKLERLATTIPVPFGAPAEAQRFYNAKRLPLDQIIDTRQAYEAAEAHVDGMPMYSVARGRQLTWGERRAVRQSGTDVLRRDWESVGPTNVGGRTRRIVVEPGRPSVIYLGAVSGGVWKSTSSGNRWKFVGEGLPNVAVNAMVMNPMDPRVLLVGTGEGYFREEVRGTGLPLRGGGIFRTVNGGQQWEQLPGTDGEGFWFVNDLVYSADGTRAYAATRTGVYRSRDGGDSWERILKAKQTGGCLDLAIRTDSEDDVLFASCGTFSQASIYRAASAGDKRRVKFKRVLSDPGMGRTTIAIAPSDQSIIYALAASNRGGVYEQGLHAVFRSDAGGNPGSWRATVRNTDAAAHNTYLLHNAVLMTLEECGFSGTNTVLPMGWYVNALAVDPTDPDTVWAGGVDWFRSSDGGVNWGAASYWWASSDTPAKVHADQHALVFHPDYDGAGNQTIYIGNDAGFWSSANAAAPVGSGPGALCDPAASAVRFRHTAQDLAITQFYHGQPFPDGKAFLGGTQDNGTRLRRSRSNRGGWTTVFGGDGGYVAIDPDDPQVFYFESQNGNLGKTTDGGTTVVSAINGLPPGNGQFLDPGGNFVFITPFVMDPQNSERLWIGGKSMFRTSNGAELWQAASAALKGRATAVAVSPTHSNRVAAGTELGYIHVTEAGDTSSAATPWGASRPRKAWVTWVAFDPANPEILYATYGGFGGSHVFRSTDNGKRWRSIDGTGATGLPDIPVHVVLVDPEVPGRLFLGTDLGVFVSTDDGATWAQENAGFGNIVTESLYLQRQASRRMLYAFTHGRSAWKVQLKE